MFPIQNVKKIEPFCHKSQEVYRKIEAYQKSINENKINDQFRYNTSNTINTDTVSTSVNLNFVVAVVAWESMIASPC